MQEDSAIVIGLQKYPGFGAALQLDGAESDAKEFYEWLRSKDGGDVPEINIQLILSSDLRFATSNGPLDCRPFFADIKSAFEKLRRASIKKAEVQLGPRIGRRLYIFMSGHGITPTPNGHVTREVGLLMSNVDGVNIMDSDSHFPGCSVADYFCVNGCFDEVFLFMDCCRDIIKMPQPNLVFVTEGSVATTKRFYAFATKWGRRAKERNFNGSVRGVFTTTLLKALNGAAADMEGGNSNFGLITAASLKTFLINNTRKYLNKSLLNVGDDDVPDIDIMPNENNGDDIIIKRVPLQKFPAIVNNPNLVVGSIDVLRNSVRVDSFTLLPGANSIYLNLPRGVLSFQTIQNGKIVTAKEVLVIYGIEDVGNAATYSLNFA